MQKLKRNIIPRSRNHVLLSGALCRRCSESVGSIRVRHNLQKHQIAGNHGAPIVSENVPYHLLCKSLSIHPENKWSQGYFQNPSFGEEDQGEGRKERGILGSQDGRLETDSERCRAYKLGKTSEEERNWFTGYSTQTK